MSSITILSLVMGFFLVASAPASQALVGSCPIRAAVRSLRSDLLDKDDLLDALVAASDEILALPAYERQARVIMARGPAGIGISHTLKRFAKEALGEAYLYWSIAGSSYQSVPVSEMFGIPGSVPGSFPGFVSLWAGRLAIIEIKEPGKFPYQRQLSEVLRLRQYTYEQTGGPFIVDKTYDSGRVIVVLRALNAPDESSFPDLPKTSVTLKMTPTLTRAMIEEGISDGRDITIRLHTIVLDSLVRFASEMELGPQACRELGNSLTTAMIDQRRLGARTGDIVDFELSKRPPGARLVARISATGDSTAEMIPTLLDDFVASHDSFDRAKWLTMRPSY